MPFCRKPIQWISSRKIESRTTALSHNTMWKAAMRRLFHATFICRCRRRWCDGQTSIAERRGKKRVYSSRYELSSIVYCPMCGEIYLRLGELQQELLRLANSKNDYTDLTDEIYRLWEERQAILVQDAECDGKRQRIEEMKAFLEEQADLPAEYNEQLVRRLIEKVTVFDEKITVRFKSGVKIDVEK